MARWILLGDTFSDDCRSLHGAELQAGGITGTMYRILLVDDEREEREGIAFLIRKYEYPLTVAQAQNGKKALEYLERESADILFTDVKMPLMNGLELAKEVNRRWPQTRIIIFSAYGEFEYARQAMEANAVNYLLKPIEVEEFRRVMEELLHAVEEEKRETQRRLQEDAQSRQNVLFKLLTGARLSEEEQKRVQEEFFSRGESCRMIHVEFQDHYFAHNEELFLRLVQTYLGREAEYVNLFPSEAWLLLRAEEKREQGSLEEQLAKLVRDVAGFGGKEMLFLVGARVCSTEEMAREAARIQERQQELFTWDRQIVWTEQEDVRENYSHEIESVYRQLLAAIESQQTKLIGEFTEHLARQIASGEKVSRIYMQNLLYSAIRMVYERYPDVRQERLLNLADALFFAKSYRELAEKFREVMREMLTLAQDYQEDDSAVIQQIRALVEREYMQDLSLDYVARQVHLAPAYVSYIFKKETGKTLIKYITDVRMERARELLAEGRLRIGQIAAACGYESQSYFNRAFKNDCGLTPRQFREENYGLTSRQFREERCGSAIRQQSQEGKDE